MLFKTEHLFVNTGSPFNEIKGSCHEVTEGIKDQNKKENI